MRIVGCNPLSVSPVLSPPAPAHTSANVNFCVILCVLWGDLFFVDSNALLSNAFSFERIFGGSETIFHNVFLNFARFL
jgi:hypothetical protein